MPRSPLVRVAVLDPHPAVRAGLHAVLSAQPDLVPVGAAADEEALWPLLHRARPSVLLVDHVPGSSDGIGLARRVKSAVLGPKVVVCATGARRDLTVAAALAGADAVVDKADELAELLRAIRAVAAGDRVLDRVTPRLQAEAGARLGHLDRAIFAMRLAGTSPRDVAATTGLSPRALDARLGRIVAVLGGGGSPTADLHHEGDAPVLLPHLTGEAA
jgi:DNA-binding NarL/FixJ family response regulator